MDSERLKDAKDGIEMFKISKLRELHYRTVCLLKIPDAVIDQRHLYEKLLRFINDKVVPKRLSINYLEFAKYSVYIMLKYACEAVISAANNYEEDRAYIIPVQSASDIIRELDEIHRDLFSRVYRATEGEEDYERSKVNLKTLLFRYCAVMSLICFKTYSFSKQDADFNKKRVCYFCQIRSLYSGIGRLENLCEEIPIKTYTDFQHIVYNGCCSDFITPLDTNTTQYDMLLSSK